MPLWSVAPIEREPSTTLVRWQIMQYADAERSFVGYAVESREGRVSSAVVTFDVEALRGVTQSGRVYQLQGRPGVDGEAAYVWNRWASREEEPTWTDVSADVWSQHAKALDAAGVPVTSWSVGNAGADRE